MAFHGLARATSTATTCSKKKTGISGYIWIGRNLVPSLLFYSFFFMGAFGAEIGILVLGFFVFGLVPDVSFVYLIVMTAIAMALFIFEGTSLNRKVKTKNNGNTY